MSIILGINCYHADSSACIIVNGKLEFAIEEERLNREKHTSKLPILSIKECLRFTNIREDEITHVAFNTKPNSNFLNKLKFFIKEFNFKSNFFKRYQDKKILDKIFRQKFNFNKNIKFYFIEHHIAHIASAFYASNFKKATGLSIDGSGDFTTLMVTKCNKNKIDIVKKISFPDSLGIFYHSMTQFLGFKKFGDEYKVMGLASYGKPIYYNKLKDNLFNIDKDYFKLNMKFFNHAKSNFNYSSDTINSLPDIFNDNLKELFKDELNKTEILIFKKNFAASVQKIYEYYFKKILKKIKKLNFSDNLVFAGGCALNSTANNILISYKYFKNIFIPFAPGDNGGCLGAAFYVSKKININNINNNFDNPYIGPKFDSTEIQNIILSNYKNKVIYKKLTSDDEKYILASDIIINKGVIGWFQNRMEFGPRSLGNRSILADPRNPDIKNLINLKVKRRENFRPFAPSILAENQNDWFEEDYSNKYMSSVMRVKDVKKKIIPGVVHIDNTSRVQTVYKNTNNSFYKLINTFYKKTGIPILLNTSFNENEPIVNSPENAIDCLLRTNIDGLFIENFFIKKIKI